MMICSFHATNALKIATNGLIPYKSVSMICKCLCSLKQIQLSIIIIIVCNWFCHTCRIKCSICNCQKCFEYVYWCCSALNFQWRPFSDFIKVNVKVMVLSLDFKPRLVSRLYNYLSDHWKCPHSYIFELCGSQKGRTVRSHFLSVTHCFLGGQRHLWKSAF